MWKENIIDEILKKDDLSNLHEFKEKLPHYALFEKMKAGDAGIKEEYRVLNHVARVVKAMNSLVSRDLHEILDETILKNNNECRMLKNTITVVSKFLILHM